MRTIIYYFSATGNSLKIAKDISAKLENTEIISIPKVINNENIDFEADNIGLIYPVFCYGQPSIVAEFVKKIKSNSNPYIFCIANCASGEGSAVNQTHEILKSNNLKLSSSFIVYMPSNYIVWGGAEPKEKQNRKFQEESKKINEIVEIIKAQKVIEIPKAKFPTSMITKLIYPKAIKSFKTQDKKFHIDEKCNKCEMCVKICPVKNITNENGKITWHNNCEHCLACIQWCPKKSIQYGKNCEKKERYTHPDIKLNEML